MNSIESPIKELEKHELNPKYKAILNGPPVKNYNMRHMLSWRTKKKERT